MNQSLEIIEDILGYYSISVVSSGYSPNLKGKKLWLEQNIPYAEFIGVNLKEYHDKSNVDMSGGIFIDDSFSNLETSNAELKICFGEIYTWNSQWEGIRCKNWNEVRYVIENYKE